MLGSWESGVEDALGSMHADVCRRRGPLVLVGLAPAAWAAEPPALAKARTLYNAANYEGAIDAAAVARRQAPWADAAALVIARSHLERYRQSADPKDLVAAREAFGTVKASALTPRDQVDLIIGLGQSLYLGEIFGAAADLFDTALTKSSLLSAARSADAARLVGDRARSRSADAVRPIGVAWSSSGSARGWKRSCGRTRAAAVANYWLAVSARGAGDVDGAWNAAVAAWVRSTLSPDTTARAPRRSRSPRHAGADSRTVARHGRPGPAGSRLGAARRVGARQAAMEIARPRAWRPASSRRFPRPPSAAR